MECSRVKFSVWISSEKIGLTPWRCKSWQCEYCNPINERKLWKKFRCVFPGKIFHIVLTTPEPKKIMKQWDTFIKRLRRKFKKIRYFRVLEIEPSEHLHIIISENIPKSFLKDWEDISGGTIKKIQVRHKKGVFEYLIKQFSKKYGARRRYAFSYNSALCVEDKGRILFHGYLYSAFQFFFKVLEEISESFFVYHVRKYQESIIANFLTPT